MATVVKKIKLQIPGGKATPAPPVGTALGPAGVNIGQFVTQFNEATKDRMGDIIPAEITVYEMSEHVSYANCGLPYFVSDVISKRDAPAIANSDRALESIPHHGQGAVKGHRN